MSLICSAPYKERKDKRNGKDRDSSAESCISLACAEGVVIYKNIRNKAKDRNSPAQQPEFQ